MDPWKRLQKIYFERRSFLLSFPNVIGVGFGHREIEGRLTDEPAIIALLSRKILETDLQPEELLPSEIDGIRVDARLARLDPLAYREFLERNSIPYSTQHLCLPDPALIDHARFHQYWKEERRRRARSPEPSDRREESGRVKSTLAPPTAQILGDIVVVKDPTLSLVTNSPGSSIGIAFVELFKLIQTVTKDHYDFVFVNVDTRAVAAKSYKDLGSSQTSVHNSVGGINHPRAIFNERAAYGSTRLTAFQVVSELNELRRMLHKTAHQWCAYVNYDKGTGTRYLLHHNAGSPDTPIGNVCQKSKHWGEQFDDDDSCMDYDRADIKDSGTAGSYPKVPLTHGDYAADLFRYHPLDLYLMGLLGSTEVADFRCIEHSDPTINPFTGTLHTVKIDHVILDGGVTRSPTYPDTPRIFHQLFVLLTTQDHSAADLSDPAKPLGNLDKFRREYLRRFRESVNCRAMIGC